MLDFDAAVFDMDGTIIDSLGIWDKIDREFLEVKRNIPIPSDYVEKIAHMSFRETAEYTKNRFNLSETPEELMQEWTEMAKYEYAHNIKLKPYAREYIELLKKEGKKVILCTSSPEIFFAPVLKNNGIYNLFDEFTNTCEAGVGKSQPAVYLLAAKKAGVKPERCLVFEDILSAAESAKRAGMLVCGVYDERSRENRAQLKKLCDIYIDSFKELLHC